MSVSQDTSAPAAGPGCGDKRRLVKTKTPGVFKRVDGKGGRSATSAVYPQRRQAAKAQRPHL